MRLRLTGDHAGAYCCRCRCYYVIRSLTSAMCYYCWVQEFVDVMSSSERSGGFRGWIVIHYCCNWFVISNRWFTAYLMTLCASHTDGCPYLATSFQRSVDLSGTVLRLPIFYGCALSVQGRSVNSSGLTWVFIGCEIRVQRSVELDQLRSFRMIRQCSPDTWSVCSFRVNRQCFPFSTSLFWSELCFILELEWQVTVDLRDRAFICADRT